jgi:hypothetical protein
MRYFIAILICAASLTLAACKSTTLTSGMEPEKRLAAARVAYVPLPSTTPFDTALEARSTYLEAYRDGYRSALFMITFTDLSPQPTNSASIAAARKQGWHDGVLAGFGEFWHEQNQQHATSNK